MDINNQVWLGFLQNIKESSTDPAILQAVDTGTAASLTEDLAKKKMKDAAQLLPESAIHGIRERGLYDVPNSGNSYSKTEQAKVFKVAAALGVAAYNVAVARNAKGLTFFLSLLVTV